VGIVWLARLPRFASIFPCAPKGLTNRISQPRCARRLSSSVRRLAHTSLNESDQEPIQRCNVPTRCGRLDLHIILGPHSIGMAPRNQRAAPLESDYGRHDGCSWEQPYRFSSSHRSGGCFSRAGHRDSVFASPLSAAIREPYCGVRLILDRLRSCYADLQRPLSILPSRRHDGLTPMTTRTSPNNRTEPTAITPVDEFNATSAAAHARR
jgi:hypothetical protein